MAVSVAMLVGYARCSPDERDLTAQRAQLARLGVDARHVHVDRGLAGGNRDRPGLREALAAVGDGDTLVVTTLDRLAWSVRDARDLVDELTSRGVRLSIGGNVHDPQDPAGQVLLNVLSMVAEFERDLIRQRTREGMAITRASGWLHGRARKLSPAQEAHLMQLHAAVEHTASELAELLGIGRATVYRVLARIEQKGRA